MINDMLAALAAILTVASTPHQGVERQGLARADTLACETQPITSSSRRLDCRAQSPAASVELASASGDERVRPHGGAKGASELSASDTSALIKALRSSRGPATIRLSAGNYGELVVKNQKFDGTVTITSADPNNKAVFDHIFLANCSGLKISNVEVQVSPGARGIAVGGSSNITLDHLDIHGVQGQDGAVGVGVGMLVRNSDDVSVTNSEFSQLTHGIGHLDNTHLKITDNTFHDLRVDGIRGGGSSYVEISRNYFTDFRRQPHDHGDAIQYWTSNTTESVHDIVVADNVFVRGDGDVVQGIFFGNERHIPFKNVTITGNAIIGGMPNGIGIGYGDGVVIENNLVLGYTDMASKIRSDYGANIKIAHNTTSHFAMQHNEDTVVLTDNTMLRLPPVGDLKALHAWVARRGGAASSLPRAVVNRFGRDGPVSEGYGPAPETLGVELIESTVGAEAPLGGDGSGLS